MNKEELTCGVVMPISEIDGLSENHWKEILNIVSQSIEKAGFKANLVSNSEDIGVIQKRIVQNLYENPIVVCDVSGKNPNVMFELGLRLAFDKPTIIIKDNKTDYSFDTSPIEHLEYPRDLRFSKIVDFREKLADKIQKTYEKSISDEDYSTFLKHFGSFKVAKIDTEEVTKEDLIMDEIKSLRDMVLRNQNRNRKFPQFFESDESDNKHITICFADRNNDDIEAVLSDVRSMKGIDEIAIRDIGEEHKHAEIELNGDLPKRIITRRLEKKHSSRVEYIE